MDQYARRRVRPFTGIAQNDAEDKYPDKRVEVVLECVKGGEQKRVKRRTKADY